MKNEDIEDIYMRILHYSLGFPPYRTGGLTKFCMDLMLEQKKMGHEVFLLWPGEIKILNKKTNIKHHRENHGIDSWEIINPMPVSYDEGITDIDAFTSLRDKQIFRSMFSSIKPDIIHIHTLMGLPKEFVEAAQEEKIKTVFSVHDFFPVCPKVTMFRESAICTTIESCTECPKCNLTALSKNKIMILQSPLYRVLKDSTLLKKIRKRHRDQYLSGDAGRKSELKTQPKTTATDYQKLRDYYSSMILKIDVVHYNSKLTKSVFEHFFSTRDTKIIPISHADINDNRRLKKFGDTIRLTYLGPQGEAKGFFLLKEALDELWLEKKDFYLNIFFTPTESSPYMRIHGRYIYNDFEKIFDETDILLAPSIWYETFGYTVLEALSYGVPVIVSDHVGAKDIIAEHCGIVIRDINIDNLRDAVCSLKAVDLVTMNRNIVENVDVITIDIMTEKIIQQCY